MNVSQPLGSHVMMEVGERTKCVEVIIHPVPSQVSSCLF